MARLRKVHALCFHGTLGRGVQPNLHCQRKLKFLFANRKLGIATEQVLSKKLVGRL
jgi:hypothetical protein